MSEYRYPPGLDRNLVFFLFTRFKPGDPIALFEHLAEKYGDIASYRIGPDRIVFLNHPELVREILVNKAASFHKERTQQRMKIVVGNGLITSEEPFHRKQRLIINPAFHRQRIPEYARNMVDTASHWCHQWEKRVRGGDDHIDMSAEMMALTLSVVARTLFDTDVNEQVRAVNEEVNAIMRMYHLLVTFPRAELFVKLPLPGFTRVRRARRHLDQVVYGMIEEHRREERDRGDLLSMLLAARYEDGSAMSDEQIRDEAMTIFLAGYETMANALTWTWYLLALNPKAEARLSEELSRVLGDRVPTLEDLPNLSYTEAVLAESMRLYPPAWAMGRRAVEDVEIGGWRCRRGTYFYFSQYVIQRSAQWWSDPLQFCPERFLGDQSKRHPFVYFPFGGGSRKCIGESFAWMEGTLVLATLAQRFRAGLEPGFVPKLAPSITLRPKGGVRMVLEGRKVGLATKQSELLSNE